jgi:hypothetical protein
VETFGGKRFQQERLPRNPGAPRTGPTSPFHSFNHPDNRFWNKPLERLQAILTNDFSYAVSY